ncbi:MAG: hypothetical protein JNN27_00780 [Planctomycetes bacterium]|nr:hypothetical protein [Planctomycetota bacterium]
MDLDELDGRLLPLAIAAARLGVKTSDLAAAVNAGDVPCVRVGPTGVLVDLDAVRRKLLERASQTENPDAG